MARETTFVRVFGPEHLKIVYSDKNEVKIYFQCISKQMCVYRYNAHLYAYLLKLLDTSN